LVNLVICQSKRKYWYWEDHGHSQMVKWSMYPDQDEPTVRMLLSDRSGYTIAELCLSAGLLYRHIHLYNTTPGLRGCTMRFLMPFGGERETARP
jgi:hypothetical protein